MNKLLKQALDLVDLELTDQLIRDAYDHSMSTFVEIYAFKNNKSFDELSDEYCRNLRDLFFELREAIICKEIVVKKNIERTKLKDIMKSIDDSKVPSSKPIKKKNNAQSTAEEVDIELPEGSRKDQVAFLIKEKGIESPSKIATLLGTNASYVHRLKKQVLNE